MAHKKKVAKFGSIEDRIQNVVFSDDDIFNIGARERYIQEWLLNALPSISNPNELEITFAESQKDFRSVLTGHTIEIDLYIEALRNMQKKLIVFEMQNECDDGLGPRSVYYAFCVGQNALEAGSDYENLAEITIVFLCRKTIFNAKNFIERYAIRRDSDFVELPSSPEWIFLFADQATGDSPQDKLMRDLFAKSYKDVENEKARNFLMNLIYDQSYHNQLDVIDKKNIALQECSQIIQEQKNEIKEVREQVTAEKNRADLAESRLVSEREEKERLIKILDELNIPYDTKMKNES